MNISHAVKEEVNGDKLLAIFERQKELMFKYHDIEKRSGLLQTEDCPVNLNDKKGQARIKDFAWRIVEEFGEALDARNDFEHYTEELIDGLHFLTELTILSGLNPEDLTFGYVVDKDLLEVLCETKIIDETKTKPEIFIEQIAMMCNCLKNKPWKQSQMITDKDAFYSRLRNVWASYLQIISDVLSPEEIADVYLKKSQVNKFRQRSNY